MSTPAYAQPYIQFAQSAIAITVKSTMDQGKLRMLPSTDAAEKALSALGEELIGRAPDGLSKSAKANWVSDRLDAFLEIIFDDQIWYSSLPNKTTIILVKEDAVKTHGLEAALRRVHAAEVIEAALAGESIPPNVASEYESELQTLKKRMPELA